MAHPIKELKETRGKTPRSSGAAVGPIAAPHFAAELSESSVDFLQPPQPSLWKRLRVGFGLLLGLRVSDIQAAMLFVRLKYAGQPMVARWVKFFAWAFDQAFCEIPKGMECLSISRSVTTTPVWLDDENPLANHPWSKKPAAELPPDVDTLVVGAGFTGAALAYHWARRAPVGRQLIVLEMSDPATGSSGRNAGLVVMGRYFTMVRDAMRKHLDIVRSDLNSSDRTVLASQFADHYCLAAYRNAKLIEKTIRVEQFDCDYVQSGWVQIREAEEQSSLSESIRIAIESGYTDWSAISPEEAYNSTGLRLRYPAGYSRSAASWHPAKWVWCLLTRALAASNVRLFTRTKVLRVNRRDGRYEVMTDRGTVQARNIVYATESYTPALDRRLRGVILPFQEQAASGTDDEEMVPLRSTVSGPWFFASRNGRRVVFGSGGPRVRGGQAGRNRPSRFLTMFVAGELRRLLKSYKLCITHEWSGTTGYTPDGYPIVGSLDGQGEYIIGGMSGSGSSVSFNAGRCIVNRILTLTDEVDDYPPEYFAPNRLQNPAAHAWPEILA